MVQSLYHRLILPADANHKNTLYSGSMLRFALEAGYATVRRRGLCPLALQLSLMLLHELPKLVSEVQQPLPSFEIEGDGHPL